MSLSRIALVLGFLTLTACGTVTASSDHLASAPSGGVTNGPGGNTPAAVEKTSGGHSFAERGSKDKDFRSTRCRHCD